MTTQEKAFDTIGFVIAWEDGDLDTEETVAGFQRLIGNGIAWNLQGHYGRTAARLIWEGHCIDTHNVLGG